MSGLKTKRMVTRGDRGKLITGAIWAVLIFSIFFFIWSQNNLVTTDKITYQVTNLPKSLVGIKIVHISDFGNNSPNVVSKVRKLNPDVIILSGGYCDTENGDAFNSKSQIQQLVQIAPTYYVYNEDDYVFYGDQDYIADTGATNITDTFVNIQAPDMSTSDFIRRNYGDNIANKVNQSVNEYNAYIQNGGDPNEFSDEKVKNNVKYYLYVNDKLKETADSNFRLIGIGPVYENDGDDAFSIIGSITQTGKAGYDAAVIGNANFATSVSTTQVQGIFSGGTFGTDFYSSEYKKGMYGYGTSTMFVSGGVGVSKQLNKIGPLNIRFMNFPQIQCITLSDGTITDKNALERFLDGFVPDLSTVWSNDNDFSI